MQEVKRARNDCSSGRLNVVLSTREEDAGEGFRRYCQKTQNNLYEKEQTVELNGVSIRIDIKAFQYSRSSRKFQMSVSLCGDRGSK